MRTQVTLQEDELSLIKAAKASDASRSELIRRAITVPTGLGSKQERLPRSTTAVARGEDGPTVPECMTPSGDHQPLSWPGLA